MRELTHWDTIITDIQKEAADIYLIDYRLPGNKNGIDVAIEILNKFPKASILFITAHEPANIVVLPFKKPPSTLSSRPGIPDLTLLSVVG